MNTITRTQEAIAADGEKRLRRAFRLTAQGIGVATVLIGCGYLAAWFAGMMAQRGFETITMKTNAALCLLLSGAALTLVSMAAEARRSFRRVSVILAALGLAVGTLTLIENLGGMDFKIDQLLAHEAPGALGTPSPNRMGTPASFSFALASLALLIFTRPGRLSAAFAQAIAVVVIAVALVSNVGYLYGSSTLYAVSHYTTIAWPTAGTLFILGVGLLCARPDAGFMAQVTKHDPGGFSIRRLLPPIIVIPVLTGWLHVTGEQWGLYDTAFGTSIMVLVLIAIFVGLACHLGSYLSHLAAIEVENQTKLKRQAALINLSPDAIIVRTLEGTIKFWSKGAEKLYGWKEEEVTGQSTHEILKTEFPEPLEGIIERVSTGEDWHGDLIHRTRDGRRVFVESFWHADKTYGSLEILESNVDITERRRIEAALRESETRARRKLESVFSPESDLGVLELAAVIDASALQKLMEDFYAVARIPMAIVDVKGKVLVGVGWQDICTQFHRVNSQTCQYCLESDTKLSAGLKKGESRLYKCKNNLWDMVTPIFVAGQHLGNVFTGQFFLEGETVDRELFRAQARQYDFDEGPYLAALDRVPRISRERVNSGMGFFVKLADMLSQLGHSNVELARVLAERDRMSESIRQSEAFYRQTLESIPGMVFTTRADGYCDYQSQQWVEFTGVPMSEHLGDGWNKLLHPEDRPRAFAAWRAAVEDKAPYDLEYRVRRRDGIYEWFKVRGQPIRDKSGNIIRWFGVAANIEAIKRAEEALRESERRYRIVADHTFDWEFWLGPDDRFLYVSPSCQRWTGYSASEFEDDAALFDRIIHPDDRILYQKHRGNTNLCETEEAQFRIIRRDGVERFISHVCVPVYDPDGAFLGVRGSNRDITERKEAEEALRASEERFRAIFESSSDCILVWDRHYNYLYANQAAIDHVETTRDKVIGKNIRDGLGHIPDFMRLWMKRVDRAFATGESFRVEDAVPVGPRLVWSESQVSPIRDATGKVFAVGVVYRDVTARKEAERAQRESEAQYRTLFSSIDQGFCIAEVIFDRDQRPIDYRFLEINPAFEKHMGLKDAAGKRMRELAPKHENYWFEVYGKVAATGESIRFENWAEQLRRWYDVYAFRVGQPEDRQVGILFNDITQRKRLEEELRAAMISAERAKAVAERANQAKDQFLAVLSHELRTPLTPVLAATALIKRRTDVPPQVLEHIDLIKRNISVEARLIDDLLDLTRIVRGKISLERVQINVCQVLSHVSDVCRSDLETKKLHFGVKVEGAPLPILADASRLQQVFWNLVKNSIKFTPEAGCVGIWAYPENGNVVVEVNDSGVGIEPEALPKIFNAFEQGDQRITRQFGGLGLGLAITKRLVEMHGGTITAHSEGKGKGATFKVVLPLVKEAQKDKEKEKEKEFFPSIMGMQILLVEDHGDTAQMMRALLESSGHKVCTAGDAEEALRVASENNFDLLISDLGLPDKSGLELLHELRQLGFRSKAIALSGFGREEDIQRSKEAGFNDHVTKPVDFDVLLATVDRVAAV